MRTYRIAIWAALAFLGVFLIGLAFALGYEAHSAKKVSGVTIITDQNIATPSSKTTTNGKTIDQIVSILKRDYFGRDKLDEAKLYQAAIQGMLQSLADTGTYYVDPTTNQTSFNLTGKFEGIGATITKQGQDIVIVAPFKNGPAEAAGIKGGDVILAVDGQSTQGWTTDQAVLKIRGPKGSKVTVSVRHTDGTTADITVTRDEVHVDTVGTDPPGGALHDDQGAPVTDLAYLSISEFTDTTASEVEKVAGDAESSGKKGLIIDVRINPGGLLQATVDTADVFLDSGTVLSEVDRNGNQNVWSAHSGGAALHIPIVILIDEYSASGAEVLTAALHDNGRAVTIGEKSFGKGTVNVPEQLGDGGVVLVTVRKWLTPKGVQIDEVGLTPDIPLTPGPYDPGYQAANDVQLQRAIDYLHGQTSGAPATATPAP